MKIEMGESLVQSWLRYVKKCQIVQLNWKSQKKLAQYELELAQTILQEATKPIPPQLSLFSLGKLVDGEYKGISLTQFLTQAEIDAFGVKMNAIPVAGEDTVQLFAVDIAFHAGGLGYSSNAATVAMKFIRSALTLLTCFNARKGIIVFATPFVRDKELKKIETALLEVQALFIKHGLNYQFDLIVNQQFKSELLQETLRKSDKSTDTSELFLRALKMMQVFDMLKPDVSPEL